MTSVNVTTTKNTVTVNGETRVVTVKTAGPQGPAFSDGDKGDVTVSSNGTAISINNSAVTSAKIADGAIVNADINASAAIAFSKLATGALPTAITVTSANISDLSIVDADISGSAAISLSKLATGALPTAITVTSANISDLSIVNADINASAAIAGTKISPDFGSQNIVTTGTGATGALGVTGDITVSGTVDGRDVATDGTKLDGIETGATADQTASEIKTAYESNSDTNAFTDADHTKLDGIETAATADQTASEILTLLSNQNITTSGEIKITNSQPGLVFEDTGANPDFIIQNRDGFFAVRDTTNAVNKFLINMSNGNITVTGTVDGVDIATRDTLFGGLTSSSGVLTNGVTATTQSASDNSTKVATTAYTDTAIANLVDSAPGTLNTLNELASALGDDANFSTTVTNSIATKLPLAGGTLTGNLVINSGNSTNDLSATNIFRIMGNDVRVTNASGSEAMIVAAADGAVTLYHGMSGSSAESKIATSSTGVSVTGNIVVSGSVDGRDIATDGTKLDGIESNATADQTASEIVALVADQTIAPSEIDMEDNEKIKLGTGDDLQIYHDGTNSNIINSTGNLHINADALLLKNAANSESYIRAYNNLQVELYYNNSKKLETTSTGTLTSGTRAEIKAEGASDEPQLKITSENGAIFLRTAGSSGSFPTGGVGNDGELVYVGGDFRLGPATASKNLIFFAGGYTERLKINSSGNVQIPANNVKLQIGANQELEIFRSDNHSSILDNLGTSILSIGSHRVNLVNGGNTEVMASLHENAAVELYYDNSKKLETTSAGVAVNTTNNSHTLEVGGSVRLTSQIKGYSGNHAVPSFTFASAASTGMYLLNSNGTIGFSNAGTHTATLDNNGNLLLVGDDQKLQIGASQDLSLYHNGTNNSSFIDNITGDLTIRGGGGDIIINPVNTETAIYAIANGKVQLRYDNSTKFETTSTGATVTGTVIADGFTVGDNQLIKLGDGGDLRLFHNGSHSYIADLGTGDIRITGSAIHLQDAAQSENMLKTFENGAVELYYDNVKQLQTTADGVGFVNNCTFSDDKKIQMGAANDFVLTHTGSRSEIHNITGDLLIRADSLKINNAANTEEMARFTADGAVELYYDNSKKFYTTSTGAYIENRLDIGGANNGWSYPKALNVQGSSGAILALRNWDTTTYAADTNTSIDFALRTGNTGNQTGSCEIRAVKTNGTNGDNARHLSFYTGVNGGSPTEKLKIEANGDIKVTGDKAIFFGANEDFMVGHDGTSTRIEDTYGYLTIKSNALELRSNTGSELYIKNNINSAVELYYDNSKKFETTSTGVSVTGRLSTTDRIQVQNAGIASLRAGSTDASGAYLYLDGDSDGNFSGSDYSYVAMDDQGRLRLLSNNPAHSGDILFSVVNGSGNSETAARMYGGGAVNLYFDHSKKLETVTGGANVTGALGVNTTSPASTIDARADSNATVTARNTGTAASIAISVGTSTNQLVSRGVNSSTARDMIFMQGTTTTTRLDSNGHLRPETDSTFDLGSNTVRWRNFYADTLYGDGSNLTGITASADVVGDTSPQLGGDLQSNGNHILMADTDQIRLGALPDVRFYHDGNHSYLTNATGHFRLRSDSLKIEDQTNGHSMITAVADGAVELYYDNVKKVETSTQGILTPNNLGISFGDGGCKISGQAGGGASVGISFMTNSSGRWKMTGDGHFIPSAVGSYDIGSASAEIGHVFVADSKNIHLGNAQDLVLKHNGSNSFITNSTGGLYIRSDLLGLEDQTNGHSYLGAQADGAVTIRYDNSVKLQTTSAGVSVTGQLVASSAITANSYLQGNTSNGGFLFYSDSSASKGVILDTNDHLRPTNNNAQDLGTSSYRWANVYTNDLNLSNEGGSNDVDGTWGSYTIQEGAEDLFLVNKRNGKKYKFNLTEVS